MRFVLVLILCLGVGVSWSRPAQAEVDSSSRFRDLLNIAAYSTAIGAAFGAALLAFTEKPGDNLDYIARGAAVGFLSGALVGSIIVFSPLFVEEEPHFNTSQLNTLDRIPDPALYDRRVVLSPILTTQWQLAGVAAKITVLRF